MFANNGVGSADVAGSHDPAPAGAIQPVRKQRSRRGARKGCAGVLPAPARHDRARQLRCLPQPRQRRAAVPELHPVRRQDADRARRTYRFLPAADPAVGWCCNQQRPGSLLLVPGKGGGVEPAPADHDDLGRGLPADPGQGGARSLAGSPVTAARLGRQQAADLLRTAGPDQRCRCRTLRPDHAPGDRGRQRAGDALLRRPAGPPA
jgi:hypothetical protein